MSNLKIGALYVCYNPNLNELKLNINSIKEQVNEIIIIDNTEKPSSELINFFNEITKKNVIPIQLMENVGIAAAQNKGISMFFNKGFDGVLLMDQDSLPPDNMVEELVGGIIELTQKGIKLACIGPTIRNKDTKKVYKPLLNKGSNEFSKYIKKDSIISSGTIILREPYENIGGFEAELFIDIVDFEWCWRAREKGYGCFVAEHIFMEHRVGEGKLFPFLNLLVPNPIRHYYQFRNFIILLKRPYVPFYWKLRGMVEKSLELLLFPIFLSERKLRLKLMLKGCKHGLLNRKGKLEWK
jgi:rhamnosyltransferase